jgi:hypothetical protein
MTSLGPNAKINLETLHTHRPALTMQTEHNMWTKIMKTWNTTSLFRAPWMVEYHTTAYIAIALNPHSSIQIKNQGNDLCFCKVTERPPSLLKFYEFQLVPLFIYLPLCNHIICFEEYAPGTATKIIYFTSCVHWITTFKNEFRNTTCLIISSPSKPQKVLHFTNFQSEMLRSRSTPGNSGLM